MMSILSNFVEVTRIAFYNFVKRRNMFVKLDPNDDSVTMSDTLVACITPYIKTKATALIVHTDRYGYVIALNPELGVDCVPQIQYNSKYNCTGFHSPSPTVGKILYDLGHKHDEVVKFKVRVRRFSRKNLVLIQMIM